MCAIIGSFDFQKFIELLELNSYRGSFSHSVTTVDTLSMKTQTYKNFGPFTAKPEEIKLSKNYYYIGHSQAPTGGLIKEYGRIHPAENQGLKLWHNGVIKDKEIQRLRKKLNSGATWDTQLVLEYLYQKKLDFEKVLSDIDGAFACVLIKDLNDFYIFRNQPSPLYIDENLSISSTFFKNSRFLEHGVVFQLDFKSKSIKEVSKFKSLSEPYYIED